MSSDTDLPPKRIRQETLTIRISAETLVWLRDVADKKEVAPSTLARMWILERLGQEDPSKNGEWV